MIRKDDAAVFGAPDLPPAFEAAVLLFDKPPGWTSFDVIRKVRRLTGVRKVGHAGTLDPMATGLLICLFGRATKRMTTFMGLEKTYRGVLRLGAVTPSYDAETPVAEQRPWDHLTDADLERARQVYLGEILQQPPMFSAVKVGGERLYKKARRGETFRLLEWSGPDVSFEVVCSKGTYVRSLAHDFGQTLGVGAHLVALRRTAIGPYPVERAWTVAALEKALADRMPAPGLT